VSRHGGEPDPIDADNWRVRKMQSAESDEPTIRGEALADRPPLGAPPDVIRALILFTTALAMLAAWYLYRGLKYPEHRHHDLLWAVLFLLYAVSPWVHRPLGGRLASKPNSSFRRTMVALFPLFALGFITFDYVIESRRQMAAEALAQRKQVWRNSVERQREAIELAKKHVSDASTKSKAALDAMLETSFSVKLPDGKREGRFDPEAYRRWKEAMDESHAAIKRQSEEWDRLTHLHLEEPGRFGRP
jgi:hypothetical protein